MPFELRPYPTPTLRPEGEYLQRAWQQSVYPMAARLGVQMKLPSVSPQPHTRLAFEGLEFAKDRGKGDEYNDRVMRAFFQQSRDIGEIGVLESLAAEIGLDPAEFRSALTEHRYSDRVQRLLRHACDEMRITGVPFFVIGRRQLTGLQSREALEMAIDEAASAAPDVIP